MRTALLVMVLSLPLLLVPGCGKKRGDRVTVYPVTGKVLVKGQPADGATVTFFAQAPPPTEGKAPPPPTGAVDSTGQFHLGTYEPDDGAPAGDYKVTISWPEAPPPNAKGIFDLKDRLQGRYSSPEKSTLKAQVPEGGGEIPPFELK
jgi:hypothetical protein